MSNDDKIAIIGVGCRFPGADNIDEFWRVLQNGENHVVDIPKERWNVDAIYDKDPDAPGKTYVRKAGLIPGYDEWDNIFFGISDSEAEQIDPQQRMVLDCVQMALENAGVRKADINDTTTGVYIGAMNNDYCYAMSDDASKLNNYSVTGNSRSIISARVSYIYNLHGPAMTIDTACSSSLAAIDTGIQAIKLGHCNMALCGGVNSILYPELFIALSKARMLSPTGQCKPFSAEADGYGRGEGCGIVLLKRLSDAQKDGDYIWATIITGSNQDGHTTSPMTAPSSVQQQRLLEKIYRENNIDPCSVQYIEAHGTGTPVGDPTEVDSLGTFFSKQSTNKRELFIGSVKSNIGHTESAAGVAGIIKVLLMMKNKLIVPSLHSKDLNPKIPFDEYGLIVVQNCTAWENEVSKRKIACVNSFGFGGTNTHAIVEQVADPEKRQMHTAADNRPYLIAISAADSWSLEHMVMDYMVFLETYEESIEKLSYTLLCKKDHFKCRFASTCDSLPQLRKQIKSAISKPFDESQTLSSRRIIFVFCGVGTTWSGMCKSLIARFSIFRQAIAEIDQILEPLIKWSLMQKLENFCENEDPFVSHICIFGCQIGLSKLWNYWGINPDAVIGQSVGEVAAAFVAGYLSLDDAITVIYERSRLLSKTINGKMMLVLNLETSIVEDIVQKIEGVSIAVHNSSSSCTISGDVESLQKIEQNLSRHSRVVIRHLNVQCAYHSQFVQTSSEQIEHALNQIKVKTPTIPIYSTVTGKIAGKDFATAKYWRQNVREPVLFSKAVAESTDEKSMNIFVEIGPKAVLKMHADEILEKEKFCVLPSMHPQSEEFRTLMSSLKDLYRHGVTLEWNNLFDTSDMITITHTPSYRYHRKSIICESVSRKRKSDGSKNETNGHLFLVSQSSDEYPYKASLNPTKTKFVYDHKMEDALIVPGAIYCEIALAIGIETFQCSFHDVQVCFEILNPVYIQNERPCDLNCFIKIEDTDSFEFHVTKDDIGQIKVASGHVNKIICPRSQTLNVRRLGRTCSNEVTVKEFYNILSKTGLSYGETLQNFTSIKFNSREIVAEINLSDKITSELRRTSIHPAVLDAVLQSIAPVISELTKDEYFRIFPKAIESVILHRTIKKHMVCYTRLVDIQSDYLLTNAVLLCTKGTIIAEFQNIRYSLVGEYIKTFKYEIRWTKLEPLSEVHPFVTPNVIGITRCEGVAQKLEHLLEGCQVHLIDLNKIGGDISNIVKEKLSLKDVVPCIIYYPGYRCCRDDECIPLNVYNEVKLSCFGLLNLVQLDFLKDIPIIVMTEDTQTSSSFNDGSINLIGSELWGMSRSIIAESKEENIYLLDINTGTPLLGETFRAIVSGITKGSIIKVKEILVRNNELYTNSLQRFEKRNLISPIPFRSNFVDESCRVCVKSSSITSITNQFFTMQNITDFKDSKDSILLKVEKVVVHPSVLYPLTETGQDRIKTTLFGKNTDGHHILTLELIGKIENENTEFMTNRIAAFYPSKVMSSIIVPTNCIVKLDELPDYHFGTLQAAFIAWYLSRHIRKKQHVCIIYDHNLPNIYLCMLQAILQIEHECTVTLRQIEYINSNILDEEVCIVFGDITDIQSDFLMEETNVQLIVSLDIFISRDYIKELRENNRCTAVHTDEIEKILDPVNIKIDFPLVKSWLLKNWKSVNMMTTYAELDVINLPSNTSLDSQLSPVRVQKKELFRKNACYIVVGGLTGLGWEIVKLLCLKGAGYVATLSRRKPSHAIEQQIENIKSICGTEIIIEQGDVSNYKQLEKAFMSLSNKIQGIPVKGIFNGAGVLDRALYKDMTEEKFENVLRSKVLGTLNLHNISRTFILDYFVLHSSIASILGNISNSNYAAANSFLDGMSYFRRTHGWPGQSINWGGLDVGMATDSRVMTVLVNMGFNILDVEDIKSCFIDSLIENATQVIYSKFDWTRLAENFLYGQPESLILRLNNFLPKKSTKIKTNLYDRNHDLAENVNDKYTKIKYIVQDTTAQVLLINKEDVFDNTTLAELGMDSQQAVEILQILKKRTSCEVPLPYLFSNEFKIAELVNHIFEKTSNESEEKSKRKLKFRNLVKSMTYTENEIYKTVAYGNERSMFFKLDYKICNHFLKPEIWRRSLQWLLSIHPELRTIYRISEDLRFNVVKNVLPYDDTIADFRNTMETIDDTTDIEYNPSKDLPIKVILRHKNSQQFVRFLINSIATDLKGCTEIFRLISKAVMSIYKQGELPLVPFQDPIDYALIYEELLESKLQSLKEFWKEYLDCSIETASFRKLKRKSQMERKKGIISKSLPGDIYCRLLNYLRELDITSMQLFTCLYQYLLYCTFRQSSIGIRAKVYVEDYPVEFKDRIWNGSNYIPIILEIPKEESINAFIKTNSENIQRCLMKSLYPFDLILKDKGIDSDTFCHEIAVEDLSPFEKIIGNGEFSMDLHDVEIDYADKECSLLVLQKDYQQDLTFCFSFDSDTFKPMEAEQFIDDLLYLLLICLDKPGTKTEDIHLETPKLILDCTDCEENEDFEETKL